MASDVLSKRKLGSTQLRVTELGFGAGPLGDF
jgi:aryl-alcohol dehydrogenase-like predicted oxidoreductase